MATFNSGVTFSDIADGGSQVYFLASLVLVGPMYETLFMGVDETNLAYNFAYQLVFMRDQQDEIYLHSAFNFASSTLLSCAEDQSDFFTLFLSVWDLSGAGTSPVEVREHEFAFPAPVRCMGLSNEGTAGGGMLVGLFSSVMFLELADVVASPDSFTAEMMIDFVPDTWVPA